MIRVTKLEKYFNKGKRNELHVLNDINVEFEENGLVCILGESGSGKTTLLNAIGGLDAFSSGSIEYDDKKLKRYQPSEIEKIRNDNFGYIFQNYYLLQEYTVAYNVKLALNTFDISEEEKDNRVEYVLEQLGIGKYKKKLVSQLSGGQQQRVSIARALVKSPKIILADEPTGNLDEENTLRTMSILKNIAKECLVILVSHEKRIAHFFADRIIEIQDGKIIRDYKNKNTSSYQKMDDGNIYLKDLKCDKLVSQSQCEINLFQSEEEKKQKIVLNLAWKNGKLYIQNKMNYDILMEGEEVGCEMIDDVKPNIELNNVEDYDFSLPRLKNHKTASLTPKEIWKLSIENLRLMGKKQTFIIGILLITAVLMTITLANFTNSFYYNKKKVIKEDTHYVTVTASTQYNSTENDFKKAFQKFCNKYAFKGKYSDIYKSNGDTLYMEYKGFSQLENQGIAIKNFSYVSWKHIAKKDLIYGRMPEKTTEIVVDKWIFERFLESESSFKVLYSDVESFLGATLVSNVTSDKFKVVGICDKDQPSVYMDDYRAVGLSPNSIRFASIQQLQKENPGKYDQIDLASNEILLPKEEWQQYQYRKIDRITFSNGKEYKIAGKFDGEIKVDYILDDSACQTLRNDSIIFGKNYQIYTDDPEGAIEYIKEKAYSYSDIFMMSAVYPGRTNIQKFEKSRKDSVSSRNLIVVAAVVIALFMIYFMIKSNVVSRTEELTVYRLIGIAKGSIIKAYLLEMFLITSYTVLPSVLITSGVIKFIGSIPSLGIGMTFPWWTVALLITTMYLMNLIISVIPVYGILSKPPATLAAKE